LGEIEGHMAEGATGGVHPVTFAHTLYYRGIPKSRASFENKIWYIFVVKETFINS